MLLYCRIDEDFVRTFRERQLLHMYGTVADTCRLLRGSFIVECLCAG